MTHMQHLQPNTTLQGGKYKIERVLGQGGFGKTQVCTLTTIFRTKQQDFRLAIQNNLVHLQHKNNHQWATRY